MSPCRLASSISPIETAIAHPSADVVAGGHAVPDRTSAPSPACRQFPSRRREASSGFIAAPIMHPKPRDAEPLPKFCEDIDPRRNGEILPPAAKAARLQRQRPHNTSGRGDDKIVISEWALRPWIVSGVTIHGELKVIKT